MDAVGNHLYAFYGHHKCASTWVNEILKQVCREAGWVHRTLVDPLTPAAHGPLTDYHRDDLRRDELRAYMEAAGVPFVTCMNADRAQAEGLRPDRAFHVIRDPRDILVSAYFSHRNSHWIEGLPELAAHRERLRALPPDEGLMAEMAFSEREMQDLAEWDYDQDDVLELKMEDLVANPYAGFVEIFEFLDLLDRDGAYSIRDKTGAFLRQVGNRVSTRRPAFAPLRRATRVTAETLLGRVYDHRFEKKTGGRRRGDVDVHSHYRKGQAGDWVNHFTPDHVDAFKERFAGLAVHLGYERDRQWGIPEPALAR